MQMTAQLQMFLRQLMPGERALAQRRGRFDEPQSMPRRSIVRVRHPAGRRVTCVTGSLWITHDNHPRETVLARGETYVSPDDNGMLVYALEPSCAHWG